MTTTIVDNKSAGSRVGTVETLSELSELASKHPYHFRQAVTEGRVSDRAIRELLASNKTHYWYKFVLSTAPLSLELQLEICASKSVFNLAALAANPNLVPQTAIKLASSENIEVRSWAVGSPSLPPDAVYEAACDQSEHVLCALTSRGDLPERVAYRLGRTGPDDVRRRIMQTTVSETLLRMGAMDAAPAVLTAVLGNSHTPPDAMLVAFRRLGIVDTLSATSFRQVGGCKLAEHPNLPVEIADAIITRSIPVDYDYDEQVVTLVRRGKVSPESLRLVIARALAGITTGRPANRVALAAALASPQAPPDMVYTAVRCPSADVRVMAFAHPHLDLETLQMGAADRSPRVRAVVAAHPLVTSDLAHALSKSAVGEVQAALAGNDAVPEHIRTVATLRSAKSA